MSKNVLRKIKSLRRRLHDSIDKNGLNSTETRELSDKIDELISEYYSSIQEMEFPPSSNMEFFYKESYIALKQETQRLQYFPSVEEWNRISKENIYMTNVSLEYVSGLNWNYLRVKILRELNIEF